MKTRLTMIAMLLMAMAASMSAQFRSDVYVPLEEGEYRVSFNLASVSQTLGVDAEEYNAVMSEWLNVVRDKKSPYENQKLLYLVPAEGEKTVGGNHAYFDLTADGKSVILITHKLKEITECADYCTIIRQGKYIDTVKVDEVDE